MRCSQRDFNICAPTKMHDRVPVQEVEAAGDVQRNLPAEARLCAAISCTAIPARRGTRTIFRNRR